MAPHTRFLTVPVNELALAGITDIEAANAFIREVYLPAHNARFAVLPAGEGSAFTPIPGVDLDEILCVEEERQVGHDNCVSYRTLKLPIPQSPMRPISSRRGSRSTSTLGRLVAAGGEGFAPRRRQRAAVELAVSVQ